MKWRYRLVGLVIAVAASGQASCRPLVTIETSDVTLFFKVYDAAHGTPSAETLQHDYIDAGSKGVRQFVPNRIVSGNNLVEAIASDPGAYRQARECMAALPKVKRDLEVAFQKLAGLDPDATFPPVTILIGANNSGGTTGKSGVLIGLEVACRASWLQSDVRARLYHLIAHEYAHVEQSAELNDETKPTTVLRQSLVEGGAELLAELISGEISNVHLKKWTKGRVRAIDEAFLADRDNHDISHWLYNGVGTPDHPGDLGYWVGYRIAKSYYAKANDKRSAIRTLLELKDPQSVLQQSGWRPGGTD